MKYIFEGYFDTTNLTNDTLTFSIRREVEPIPMAEKSYRRRGDRYMLLLGYRNTYEQVKADALQSFKNAFDLDPKDIVDKA